MNDGSHAAADNGESNLASENHLQRKAGSESDAASSSVASSPNFGVSTDPASGRVSERLRAAREALGLSAADVAVRTRITLRHVVALEAGDYSALPGRPYALGFARGYALAVGLDGAIIADAVRAELEGSAVLREPRAVHQFEVGDPAKTPSRMLGWLALLLGIGLLAMGAVFWRSYYAPAVALPALAGVPDQLSAEASARSEDSAAGRVPAQAETGSAVVFTALEEGIWVKFYDGQGKQLMQRQLSKGEVYTVPADAEGPKLWTGRPDALAITVGGQSVARLSDTEKVVKDVPVDAASLRARSQPPAVAPLSAQPDDAAPRAIE